MATMNISLPDPMRDWVEKQLESGLYANNSDYIRDLIRKDQQCAEKLAVLQQVAAVKPVAFHPPDVGSRF